MATMKGCVRCGKSVPLDATECPHCHADPGSPVIPHASTLTKHLTPKQRALFDAEYAAVKKDGGTAAILAFLFGGLGAHHFYMGAWVPGLLYLVFCWTFIPLILGVIEAFFMGGRVRDSNFQKARLIAARIDAATP